MQMSNRISGFQCSPIRRLVPYSRDAVNKGIHVIHLNIGQPDIKTPVEAIKAIQGYNEEYIDKYVYFSDQTGSTDLGVTGKSTVTKQDYKLIIHEGEDTPGYKYHYTIKHVDEISGVISMFQSLFESGTRLRFVIDTNKLYRFDGNDPHYVEDESLVQDILTCNWTPDTGSWGVSEDEPPIVKREGAKLTLAEIEQDILEQAKGDEAVIHGNVNILADNIVKSAEIISSKVDGHAVYEVRMELDCAVANADEASQLMLKNANSASECKWVEDENGKGPVITYQVWDNGLLKYYSIDEAWEGKIKVALLSYNGGAVSSQQVWYSYSAADTSMTEKLEMLEDAKKIKG